MISLNLYHKIMLLNSCIFTKLSSNLISLFKTTINLIFLSKEIKCCEATFIWQTVVRPINTTTDNPASYFTHQILYSYAQTLKINLESFESLKVKNVRCSTCPDEIEIWSFIINDFHYLSQQRQHIKYILRA